jgi:hypothetical protein
MTKRILLAIVAVVALASAAGAQEAATIVLRSGERVSGQLVDHGGSGFRLSVGGADRNIPTGEVAVIEFAASGNPALSNDMVSRLNNGQHVVVLRNGQQFAGNLYDIGGTTPLRITVDTDSGRRELASSEVARIYLAPVGGGGTSGTTGAQPSGTPGNIAVVANQTWTPTGLIVRAGEVLTSQTTGEIQLSGDPNDKAHSAGAYSQRRPGPGAPLPQELAGALIGRIGNGQPFAIGNNTSVRMPESGQLFLGINDDSVGDNAGQYSVSIQRRSRRR